MATRIYAPEPLPGPIELEMVGMTRLERMRHRARALASIDPGAAFTLDGIQIQLLSPIRLLVDARGIAMELRARDATTLEFLPMSNPYIFINPPLKIGNGTWRKTGIFDELGEVERENMEERPMEALKRVVRDAVVAAAREMGWQG